MPRQQKAPLEVNNLSGGLNTDANPLNFPPNSCKDMDNFILNRNGRARRRPGLDFEDSYNDIFTTATLTENTSFNTFKWENAGGDPDKELLVQLCGNEMKVFDLSNTTISSEVIYTYVFTDIDENTFVSFTDIDSILVAVNGSGTIYSFEYDGDTDTISSSISRILVRDLWGVEDLDGSGNDLFSGANLSKRLTTISDEHLYNLRNQTWAIPKMDFSTTATGLNDPITFFQGANNNSSNLYPSNSDNVNIGYYAGLGSGAGAVKRMDRDTIYNNPVGNFAAPRGYFIIDLLNRGSSRETNENDLNTAWSDLTLSISGSLPTDQTTQGATIAQQFAGRVFFAGFGADVTGADSRSPKLSSYLMFSQLVQSADDINKCYQKADPTADIDNEIAATDGGFIRIDGAYNIQSLMPSGNSLFIIAENGVWRLLGGNEEGFSADNYRVDKVSNNGCRSPKSVVDVEGTIMFWGENGIFAITGDAVSEFKSENISRDKIQKLYDNIGQTEREQCFGVFDRLRRTVHWIYNNNPFDDGDTKELILDVDLGAFYPESYQVISNRLPKIIGAVENLNLLTRRNPTDVEVNGDQVQVNGEDVEIGQATSFNSPIGLTYVVLTGRNNPIKYSFAYIKDEDFLDWKSFDDTGIDAAGYIVTGEFNTGDNQRRKQAKSLIMHLERTEDNMELDGSDLVPRYQSSCLVQSRWDWSDSANANRWSTPRQYYRYNRHYIPEDIDDPYDTGYETIVTKDVLRGHGKALSIKISTEPAKDCRVLGWSMIWGIGNNEGDN